MHLHSYRENRPGMKILMCSFVILSSFIMIPRIDLDVFAAEINQNEKVTIVTSGTVARLCPIPGCGPDQHITRIPEGTVLKVESSQDYAIGTFKVKWFEVVYQKNRGWISIYDTDKDQ